MSEGYKGQYAPDLYNENKRYYLFQAQEYKSLTDAELRDMHQMSNTSTRHVIDDQIATSAIRDGFKITEEISDNNIKNFSITGGDGTNAAVLYLNGFRLALRNTISYNDQNNSGSITDDAFTNTSLPALTTPGGEGSNQTFNYVDINSDGNPFIVDNDILCSLDSGRNYSNADIPGYQEINGVFYSINFFDSSKAYIVGINYNTPIIFRTTTNGTDGGQWDYINFPPLDCSSFYGVNFTDTNRGYVVGNNGVIIRTQNGSAATNLVLFNQVGTGLTSEVLRSVKAPNTVTIVGDSGTILFSNDTDGTHFDAQTCPVSNDLYSITYAGSVDRFICGTSGTILKSSNFGSWSAQSSDTTENLRDIHFYSTTDGWAVGDKGTILKTLDGGSTWDATILDALCDFKSIAFNDTTGFLVGVNTFDSIGVVFRTLDNGLTWDPYRTDYVYIDMHLAEVSADTSSEYYDPSLLDSVVGIGANRLRIVQDVKVSEGWPAPSDYTYSDSSCVINHYTYPLAKITRSYGQDIISQSNITDLRKVVRTISEIDYLLNNHGIDTSALAPQSVGPDQIMPNADYSLGSLFLSGDSTTTGNSLIGGTLKVLGDSTIGGDLNVSGSTIFGDPSSTHIFNGPIIQNIDTSSISSYTINSTFSTGITPLFNIHQDGSGSVFQITTNTDSSKPIFDVTSAGTGYDLNFVHMAKTGGILKSYDDSTQASFFITKDSTNKYSPIMDLYTNALGPVINIHNTALCDSASIHIDQSSGTAISIRTMTDGSSIVIDSSSTGTDLKISHSGRSGLVFDVTSSGSGLLHFENTKSTLGVINQHANESMFILNKDSSGSGRILDIYHQGIDPAVQINNEGQGIGLHISHVGDSSATGLDVFVAGSETGAAVKITKANRDSTSDVGQALYIINQGYSQSLQILHDNTDSSASMIELANFSNGYDASAIHWRIDKNGNFFTDGDVTTAKIAFDSTHYFSSGSIFLDSTQFGSTNPGVVGQVFIEDGFLRISDGTNMLPPPGGFGQTGLQGITGIYGATGLFGQTGIRGATGLGTNGNTGLGGDTGIMGLTGIMGFTGLALGATGIQGLTGPYGLTGLRGYTGTQGLGVTGLRGPTGIIGPTGIFGAQGATGVSLGDTGIKGVTGIRGLVGFTGVSLGQTGIMGNTGVAGNDGEMGPQGDTGISIQGDTGIIGVRGVTGLSLGATGIRGLTGIYGVTGLALGATGIAGLTGVYGLTGISGSTGFNGLTGLMGFTGLIGLTGLALGATGIMGFTGISGGPQGPTGVPGPTGVGVQFGTQLLFGTPIGGFSNGIFPWDGSTITTPALNDVNSLLLAIAPAAPGVLSGSLTLSNTIKYPAVLPTGLSAAWYQNGAAVDSTITDYVVDGIYNLTTPNTATTFKAGSTFGGDVGTVYHVVDGTNSSFRDMTTGIGVTGNIEITDLATYNSIWRKANARINYTQTTEGYKKHAIRYQSPSVNQVTSDTNFWYDDSNGTPIITTPIVTQNTLGSSRYLSGIRYYSTGDTFDASSSVANIASKGIRPTNPINYSMPGVTSTNVAISGSSIAWNGTYNFHPLVTINASNVYNIDATLALIGTKPSGTTALGFSASQNRLVNSYPVPYSTNGVITMFDEQYRWPLSSDFTSIPVNYSDPTGSWNSTAILTNGNAQLYNSTWFYPSIHYTSGYLPAQQVGADYTSFSGSQQVVWAANIGVAHSSMSIAFTGILYTDISADNTGSLNFDVKLPSVTDWLDAGRAFGDGSGCRLGSSSGSTLNLSFGINSSSGSNGVVFIRATLRDSSAAKASKMIVTGT